MALSNQLSIRKAALTYEVPYTYSGQSGTPVKGQTPMRGREAAFSKAEEELLLSMVEDFGELGGPLSTANILEAAVMLIASLPLSRQKKFKGRFEDGRPGPKWARCFLKRYKGKLTFEKIEQT